MGPVVKVQGYSNPTLKRLPNLSPTIILTLSTLFTDILYQHILLTHPLYIYINTPFDTPYHHRIWKSDTNPDPINTLYQYTH